MQGGKSKVARENKLKVEFIDKNTLKLDKVLNKLDRFVIDFIRILEKYVDYVIISGYVSILLGRSRATEDIDIFIKEVTKDIFKELYQGLKNNGYWCINVDDFEEVYKYLNEGIPVRFALKDTIVPNFEVAFANNSSRKSAFEYVLVVVTQLGNINISSIERQIAYKKFYLKSDKDLEDAIHLEVLFGDKLNKEKIDKSRRQIENARSRQNKS